MPENPVTTRRLARLQVVASVCLLGLIALCLAWETVLAPIKPGGSWLMLKVLPLLAPLFGILNGRRYTYQWSALLILVYFVEGAVRAWSDRGLSAQLAAVEVILATTFFAATVAYAKLSAAPPAPRQPSAP